MADRAVMIALGTKLGNMTGANALSLSINKLAGLAAGIFSGVAVYKGFGLLKSGLESVIASASQAQDAANNLRAAFDVAGFSGEGLTTASAALAASLQSQTRYSDDAIMEMQGLLVTYGVMPSRLDAVTKATLDLATATRKDLPAAAQAVAKALDGETGALKKMGVTINTENLPAGQAFDKVLGAIQERFGGRAQADAKTYSGQLAQLANMWDDLKEQLGGFIIESGGSVSIMETLKGIIQDVMGYLEQYGPVIRASINEGLAKAVEWMQEFASSTKQWVEQGGLIEAFQRLHSMFDALVGMAQIFWGTIKLIGTGVWWIAGGLVGVLEGLKIIDEGMMEAMEKQSKDLGKSALESFSSGWENLTVDALKALGTKQQAMAQQQQTMADAAARKAQKQAADDAKMAAAKAAALAREAELAKRLTDEEAKRAGEMAKQYGMMNALERAQVRAVLGKLKAGGQSAFENLGGKESDLIGKSKILQEFVGRQGFDRRLAEKELGGSFAREMFGKVDVQAVLKNEINANLTVDGPSIARQITEQVWPKIMEVLNNSAAALTGAVRNAQSAGQAVAGASL